MAPLSSRQIEWSQASTKGDQYFLSFSEHLFSILREYASEELQETNRWKFKTDERNQKTGEIADHSAQRLG